MWQNSLRTDYILTGKDAEFFLTIAQDLISKINEYDPEIHGQDEYDIFPFTGCIIFDNATLAQKVFLLNFCLKALLDENIPAPQPTHILEACAYSIFAYLEREIEYEIGVQLDNQKTREKGEYSDDYYTEYYYFTFYRRQTYEIYKYSILSVDIAMDIQSSLEGNNQAPYETLEEWLEEYRNTLALNHESTDIQEWKYIIDRLAHTMVLGDDKDFQTTSLNPQLVDGVTWVENLVGITDDYLTNKLPKVTDEGYEKALNEINSFSC